MIRTLVVGTCDTKADEIEYMCECIRSLGAQPVVMDVSVLGQPGIEVDISKHEVARACGMTNESIIDLGDENHAMAKTAEGAATLASRLAINGDIDAVMILGGTMGTDLALDVLAALPFGMPKVLLSTIAFSPLIPVSRIASDLTMVLWAGACWAAGYLLFAVQAFATLTRARIDGQPG